MISLISKRMVHFFVDQKSIENEDKEVYMYGTELIVSTSISFISTFLITLLFSKWYYFFIFYLIFIPLRMNAGGYHADTYEKCFLTTTVVYVAYIIVLNYISSLYIAALIMVLSIIVVFKYAPIIHVNNIITEIGVKKRKFYSRLLIIIYCFAIIALLLINAEHKIIYTICLATAAVTISIIISILMERRNIK